MKSFFISNIYKQFINCQSNNSRPCVFIRDHNCGLSQNVKANVSGGLRRDWNLTRSDQSRPPCAQVMESYKNEADDKVDTYDSEEEDNMDDDLEQDPKVLLGRRIYNYNKQVDAELFRLQLKEVRTKRRVYDHYC